MDKTKILCLCYICLTTSIRCLYDVQITLQCGLCRETLRSSYEFTGIVASAILFNSAQWLIWKNRKPLDTAKWHRTARWLWGQRRVLDGNLGQKMIIDSCYSGKEPARSRHYSFAWPIKSYRLWRSSCGNPKGMAWWSYGQLATCQQFPDLSLAVFFSSIIVFRLCL